MNLDNWGNYLDEKGMNFNEKSRTIMHLKNTQKKNIN